MAKWTEADIPDQTGRKIIVTGANTGLGFETARALTQKGAEVTLACRNPDRGEEAAKRIMNHEPPGNAKFGLLDLADLSSVRKFAKHAKSVDCLINNAGVMIPPFSTTEDGWESQFGINYIGHHLLTGLLYPKLQKSQGRVVTLSSIAHRKGRIDFANLRGEKRYSAWREYQQSKLADLLFGRELARRQDDVLSVIAHPGVTKTELARSSTISHIGMKMFAMDAATGALPQIYAATMDVEPASYWGPTGFYEAWGKPGPAKVSKSGRNDAAAAKLWEVGEDATGKPFGF